MRAMIGQELLRKLPPAPADVRDTKLRGFVLRVRQSGNHSYYATWDAPREQRLAQDKRLVRWFLLGGADVLTPHEAREQARQVLADVVKGHDPVAAKRAKRGQITFSAFLSEHYEPWAAAQRKTGKEQTARLARVFGSALGDLPLPEISAFHVERWRSARLKGRTASTINRDLNTLRGALSRAVEWGLLAKHPLAGVKASRVDAAAKVRYLSTAEESRLREALAARDSKRRERRERANAWRREREYAEWPAYGAYTDHLTPIVLLALNTGLRRGELFALRWEDVDLAHKVLTVRGSDAKSGQTRHVPLNAEAVAVARALRDASNSTGGAPDTLVLRGRDGEQLDDIKTAWLAVLRAAKVDGFRFHDLRHTFASKLVMRGVDLNTVRELLGHADLKMTLRYAHLAPEHKAAAVAKLVSR